jgi:uncharacterized protein
MDPLNHFEIPFDDYATASKFYTKVFDWKIQPIPEMDYNVVYTTEVDENRMAKKAGAINGGMFKRNNKTSKNPVLVITVRNLDETIKKIKKAGGKITAEKAKVGDMGLYAQFEDTEGNILGIWETLKPM